MAIRPEDIIDVKVHVAELEKEIDEFLGAHWNGTCPATYVLEPAPPAVVVWELVNRYEAAGWEVDRTAGSNSEKGPWVHLKFDADLGKVKK